MDKQSKLRQLAQMLLATTCLTAATTVPALATITGVYNEPSYGTDGATYLGTDFSTVTVLPTGITTVNGFLCSDCGLGTAWFEIPGLTPGDTIQVTDSATDNTADIGVFNSSDGEIDPQSIPTIATSFDVTDPSNGKLLFAITDPSGDQGGGPNFTVQIADEGPSGTPEPGTEVLAALGLGTAVALRRKLNKA